MTTPASKVPYTDAGIQILVNGIRQALLLGHEAPPGACAWPTVT